MKRFWLVLLALGMLFAFSSSVFAADVKFTGSFYAAGMYMNKTSLQDDVGPSTAFYYQRLRVNMDFIATPGLQLKTRFDVLERIWGGIRSGAGAVPAVPAGMRSDFDSAGTRAENENIAFDYAYIWYASKIGIWSVGIMEDGAWGTKFGDNSEPEAKIAWLMPKMPFIVGLQIVKIVENSPAALNAPGYGTQTDVDQDKYQGFVIYNFKGGQAGLLGYYVRVAQAKPVLAPGMGWQSNIYGFVPYARAKIGPVAVETELHYQFGKARKWEAGIAADDVKISSWSAYVDALADFGMWYVGVTGAFVSGDGDPADTTARGTLDAGRDWNPLLILFNYDRTNWAGGLAGFNGTNANSAMTNALFGMVRAGVRPVKDLDIMMAVAYAEAHKKRDRTAPLSLATASDEYGWEIDVTATYKITNNLSYMLGVGYLITGDWFEGASSANKTQDNFLVINKLTLTF